jgi:hypothetical protein
MRRYLPQCFAALAYSGADQRAWIGESVVAACAVRHSVFVVVVVVFFFLFLLH